MKLWLPSEERLPMMNEDVWFRVNQKMLLRMANTDFGRDLLCINKSYPRVIEISKRHVKCYVGTWGGRHHFQYDFRVGAKWGNVIRYRWDQFQSYSRYFLSDDNQYSPAVRQARSMVATTTTAYPNPNVETTSVDGVMLRDGVDENWATIRAGAGNLAIDTGTGNACAELEDRTNNNWTSLTRSGYLFDTSGIPDAESIDSAIQSLYGYTKSDAASLTPTVNIYSFSPASNTALVAADFAIANFGSTAFCDTAVTYASWSGTGAYSNFTYNATGLAAISKTGITKTAGMFVFDATNTTPTVDGNSSSNRTYMFCKFADEAGTGSDPVIVVQSSVVATGQYMSLNRGFW